MQPESVRASCTPEFSGAHTKINNSNLTGPRSRICEQVLLGLSSYAALQPVKVHPSEHWTNSVPKAAEALPGQQPSLLSQTPTL